MTGLISLKPAYLPHQPSSTDKPDWKVVGVLLTGTFLAVLDFLNVAIPQLQRERNTRELHPVS